MNSIVGWTKRLSELKHVSREATKKWRWAGCPLYGEVWEEKKDAKMLNKLGLKEHKRGGEMRKMAVLRNAMKEGDTTNFWRMCGT